jgi:hypothetical protein
MGSGLLRGRTSVRQARLGAAEPRSALVHWGIALKGGHRRRRTCRHHVLGKPARVRDRREIVENGRGERCGLEEATRVHDQVAAHQLAQAGESEGAKLVCLHGGSFTGPFRDRWRILPTLRGETCFLKSRFAAVCAASHTRASQHYGLLVIEVSA